MPRPKKITKQTNPENLNEKIRKRAYEISQERGESEGNGLSDWLKAEKEIKAKYETKKEN